MVKAFHRAGIEVILDVVYNHTAEGKERADPLFKGFANGVYTSWIGYGPVRQLHGHRERSNANEPLCAGSIRDGLHCWVEVMHVDGFRFDLASILSRDESGRPLANPPSPVGHRFGSRASRYEADCRGMGRGRTLPGRLIRRRFLEKMERPIPRRCAQDLKADNDTITRLPYRLFGRPGRLRARAT